MMVTSRANFRFRASKLVFLQAISVLFAPSPSWVKTVSGIGGGLASSLGLLDILRSMVEPITEGYMDATVN